MLIHRTSISGWIDTSRRYGSSVRGKIATLARLAGLVYERTSPSDLLIKRSLSVWSVRKSPSDTAGVDSPGDMRGSSKDRRRPRTVTAWGFCM
jgi:hypothetical protein